MTICSGVVRMSALSAMKWTPQKMMNSASSRKAACLGELEGVAAEIGELDDVVALVVVAEDDETVGELGAGDTDAFAQFAGAEVEVGVGDFGLPSRGGGVRRRAGWWRGRFRKSSLGRLGGQAFGGVGGGYECGGHLVDALRWPRAGGQQRNPRGIGLS